MKSGQDGRDYFSSGLKTRVKVTNSKFNVPIKDGGINGRFRGEILPDGALKVYGEIDRFGEKFVGSGAILTFSTSFRDGVFSARGSLGSDYSAGGRQYQFTLTRATDAAK